MSDKDDDDAFRHEVCAKLAGFIKEGLPTLPVGATVIEGLIYGHLRNELFEFDLRQSEQRRATADFGSAVARSAFGSLPHFGEAIDELAESGRDCRRIVNAAVRSAADIEHMLTEAVRLGPDKMDITGPIEMQTERIVRVHRIESVSFVVISVIGVAAVGAANFVNLLTWKQAIVSAIAVVIGARIGTRFIDAHDHK
jgi:hypothetical protein